MPNSKNPSYDEKYEIGEDESTEIEITEREKLTTIAFALGFIGLLIYSMLTKQSTAYTILLCLY